MRDCREESAGAPAGSEINDPLTEVLRRGAQKMLRHAIEAEVAGFLAGHEDLAVEIAGLQVASMSED